MKKLALSLAAAGFVFSASPAFAKSLEGTVEAIDRDRGIVMMDDGSEFLIPKGVRIGNFEPGAYVKLRFDAEDGENTIKSMRKAKPKDEFESGNDGADEKIDG